MSSHDRIYRCHSATFHIDGATYQIVANDEPTNGLKILRKKSTVIDLSSELAVLTNATVTLRLKKILDKLESGLQEEISPEILKKNIQYALELLQSGTAGSTGSDRVEDGDSAFDVSEAADTVDPLRQDSHLRNHVPLSKTHLTVSSGRSRQDESDHDLSEVDEEVIPEEVKAWLASTFTKNFPPRGRTGSEPRPRFRSVANAIRVGLFVDRFYRQLSSNTLQIPIEVVNTLKEINDWHFDIYKLHSKSNNHSLKYVVKDLFSRYGILQKFKINLEKLDCFIAAVEAGYTKLKNPYHNDIHAAEVTQTLHFFLGSSRIVNVLSDLEIFSLLFAAVIHDFEHTGRTNNFHVNVGTDLALMYNDRSVLENHHVSAAFRLLKEDDKNILSNLKKEDFREFRTVVVEMVLSTDMSTHFAQLKNIRNLLKAERPAKNTTAAMSFILHSADISHPGKPWRIHKKLAESIIEEFFLQGDEEGKLGLPFSPLCDRNSVLVPESQISFIEFIVEPTMTVLGDLMDYMVRDDKSPTGDGGLTGSPLPKGSTGIAGLNRAEAESIKATRSLKHTVTRRAESDNTIRGGEPPPLRMLTGGSRTSSFPLQTGNSNCGPNLRPWVNHMQENKAKWRMIAAERENRSCDDDILEPSKVEDISAENKTESKE